MEIRSRNVLGRIFQLPAPRSVISGGVAIMGHLPAVEIAKVLLQRGQGQMDITFVRGH